MATEGLGWLVHSATSHRTRNGMGGFSRSIGFAGECAGR